MMWLEGVRPIQNRHASVLECLLWFAVWSSKHWALVLSKACFSPHVPPVLFSLQSCSAYIVLPWENTLDDLVENTLLISYLLLLWSISLNGFKILDIDRLLNLSYPFHIKIVGECKFLKRWYTSLKLTFGDTHEQTMRCIMFNVVAYLI